MRGYRSNSYRYYSTEYDKTVKLTRAKIEENKNHNGSIYLTGYQFHQTKRYLKLR